MALSPDSESPDAGRPADYRHDHPHESPGQWGWHGKWGGGARVAGAVVAAILLLMTTTTNYQFEYILVLWLLAAGVFGVLLIDRHRRRNSWRR
jgi:hypothetical protein